MSNPSNIMKHYGDPAVQKLLKKLGSKMGGGMPFGGGMPDFAGGIFVQC